MGEEAHFVARYASVVVTGGSFGEVGDVLHKRGFNMRAARQTDHGVLIIPHSKPGRAEAHLFRQLDAVEEEIKAVTVNGNGRMPVDDMDALRAEIHQASPKPMKPVQPDAAALAEAAEAGTGDAVDLQCGTCGAVHPLGVVCMVPIFFEQKCCYPITYAHKGPHEAGVQDADGVLVITHRWIEERVITDLPFNSYGPLDEDDEEED
jgi:hypothetical protein